MFRKTLTSLLFLVCALAATAQERADSAAVRMLRSDFGVEFTEGNTLTLFRTGQEKFDDLFDAVRRARAYIYMEYFNFRNDSISALLFDLLAERAAAGVEVRALFDGFGNSSNNRPLKPHHVAALRRRGIDIVEFDPLKFPWVNHAVTRDHRKIVVIDGQVAYTGGMNVADYYITGKPEFGDWRDIHCRIQGAAVAQLEQIFTNFWLKATGRPVEARADDLPLPAATAPAAEAEAQPATAGPTAMVGVVDRVPRQTPKIIKRTFLSLIDNAQTQIQIINPYFIPGGKIMRALKRALRRGVDVQIMVSDKSDIPVTPRVVEHCVHRLMKHGAEVYMYTGGFHHSKIMMVDSCVSFLGSANLNSRSLRYDYECNLLVADTATTRRLQHIFETDKQTRCYRLTPEAWRTYSHSRRFAAWFYQILTPFL
ncbi:MAG: cardiolipin synthase [Bacteroidaceae bacterium]|nr:cardiolipin synthase [Bacteroidaceae bacterium]